MIMSEMQEGIQMAMMTGQAMAFVVDKGVTLTNFRSIGQINKNECIVYNTENKECMEKTAWGSINGSDSKKNSDKNQ